ncbi:MAG: hypothetical protein WCK64_07290 [Synechococcaceae cyanobacterium ELA445]
MESNATQFERGFLFSVGRHFWNFVAVCGFITLASGGLAALDSYNLTKDEWAIKNKTLIEWESYDDWFESECSNLNQGANQDKVKHEWLCEKTMWWNREAIGKDKYFPKFCSASSMDGTIAKESKYVNGVCRGFEYSTDQLSEFRSASQSKYQDIESKNEELKTQKAAIELKINAKLLLGATLAACGLGVIAVSSLMAAILAVERNTRK